MKKILTLILCAVLCMSVFAGCGDNAATTDDVGGREVVNIWLQMTESFDIAWWNSQFEQYNAQSEKYYIKISWVDGSAWDSKILAARENNTAPDIVTYPISGVAQQAQYGTLAPLNDYIPELSEYLKDFDEKAAASITDLKGNVYGIPRLLEPSMLLFYRKDILSAAGWNEPPKTLAELEQCCTDVTNYLNNNSSLGINNTLQVGSTNNDYGWVSWAIQAQLTGKLTPLTEDWSAADVDGYEAVAEYWADLHDLDGVPAQGLTSGGYKDDYAAIFENKVAMQQCGTWIWGTLHSVEDYADLRDKIGVAPWPTETGKFEGEVLCSMGGWSLAIDRGAHCPEGAADFIKWCLLAPESAQRLFQYFEAGNFCKISPRKSVNELITAATGSNTSEMRELLVNVLLPNSMMEPTYPWEISQSLGNAYVSFVAGGQTAADAIAAARAEINGYINTNKVAENRFN